MKALCINRVVIMQTIPAIGHNRSQGAITIEIKAFNSMTRYCGQDVLGTPRAYPAGTTLGDVVRDLDVPEREIFLILVNGRDVSPGLVGQVRFTHELEDGDVVALSGPVPYSYGYGAPVV